MRRRKVFYIAGFDPASPRKYHGIFSVESAKQAAVTGGRIAVGPLEERGEIASGWSVVAERDGHRVEVDYECLRWNDIVRQMWPKVDLVFFLRVWRALFVYGRRGVLALPSRTVLVTALAPVIAGTVYLILYAAVVALACLAGAAAARSLGWPVWTLGLAPLLLWLAATPLWMQVDRRVPVTWLGRGMVCVSDAARGRHGAMEERLDQFARRLIGAAAEPGWDEILIVGHSMGCQQAARAVGRAVRLDPGFGTGATPISLLTLGQLIPLYSLMRDDGAYADDFAALLGATTIPWVDITGPSDPGSVCEVHPLAGLKLGETPPGRPLRWSPRFHAVLSAGTYRKLRRAPLGFHFQYLMASELPGGYDYFDFITGARALGQAAAA